MRTGKEIIEDKRRDYGDAVDSMTWCAAFWTLILQRMGKLKTGEIIEADEACELMIGFKLSRDLGNKRRDNLQDIVGYAEIAAEKRGYK
jgi:hypothetical protein